MSDGLNKVMLLGNLAAAPELRFTQAGQAVLNLRLATNESYLDKDKVRQERTDFHSVVVWGKRGESLAKILDKGSALFVEGSLRTSSYDDRDGNKRYKTEIHATNILLTGGRGSGGVAHGAVDTGDGDGYATPAAPSRAAGGPATGAGDFEVSFGRDKGKRISEVEDLSWLRGTLERDLADESKAKFHAKSQERIAAIDAELARRAAGGAVSAPKAGGGYASRGSQGGGRAAAPKQAAPEPVDYDGGYGGGDDDIPFASCDASLDLAWMDERVI